MAFNKVWLTKRTIGASSAPSFSSSTFFLESSSSSTSSSASSRSAKASSAADNIRSTVADSLSSSTNTGSTVIPVVNFISSMAMTADGSLCATYKRLPRLNNGSTRCFSISSLLTTSCNRRSKSNAAKSSTGIPNSSDAISANVRAFTLPIDTAAPTKCVLSSLAFLKISCACSALIIFCSTRRRGKPDNAAIMATLFNHLFKTKHTRRQSKCHLEHDVLLPNAKHPFYYSAHKHFLNLDTCLRLYQSAS